MRRSLIGWTLVTLACGGAFGSPDATEPPGGAVPAEQGPPGPTGDTGVPEASPDPTPAPARRRRRRGPPRPRPAPVAPAPAPTDPAAPPQPAVPKPAAPKSARPPGEKPEGIVQVGPRSYTVTRALVTAWQEDPDRLGAARELDPGWELVGLRPRHAWHLGMRNKDLVLEVNGHKLNTRPQLLNAYLACKNDSVFDVSFVRAGQPMSVHFQIVD